jgi:hypothetical protein
MRVADLGLAMMAAATALGQAAPATMEHHDAKVKIPSTSLTITTEGKSVRLSLSDLQAMPQRTLKVHNGHSKIDQTYTGVGMDELLKKFGITLDDGGAKKVYHTYVRFEGTDKYFVLYSASELEPSLHTGDAILALTVNGQPLTEDGKFKLVAGAEKKPARWVTNVEKIAIVTVE